MNKKVLMVTAISLSVLLTNVCAKEGGKEEVRGGSGFTFYEDKAPSDQKKKKTKLTVEELLQQILDSEKEQEKTQKEILALMKDQYDVPKMVKINGKECLANSSAECFVMPIAGDAKRIPVMRKWIEEPNIKNAIAYYKWQSVYFNKVMDAGYSLHFAGKSTDYKHIGVPTYMEKVGDYQEQDRLKKHKATVISRRYAKNMEVYILIGENAGFDVENKMSVFNIYQKLQKMGIKTKFVFKSKESLAKYNEMINAIIVKDFKKRWDAIPSSDKVISKNTFIGNEDIEVHITPMYILRYIDPTKTKRSYTQVIGAGKDNWREIIEGLPRSLILNKVAEPSEFSGSKADEAQMNEIDDYLDYVIKTGNEERRESAKAYKKVLEDRIQEEIKKKEKKDAKQ